MLQEEEVDTIIKAVIVIYVKMRNIDRDHKENNNEIEKPQSGKYLQCT